MGSLLKAENISKEYVSGTFIKKRNLALKPVSFSIDDKTPSITAIAGESGSGKTTFARVLAGILKKSSGVLRFKDKDLDYMTKDEELNFKKDVQTIFQDPFEVYNPFYKVDHVLTTPLKKFGMASSKSESDEMIISALEEVGLRPDETLGRYPHQLSGGQRQRIMVARAFLLRPKIIIADEPVSMVDASLRATILEELKNLRKNHGISIIYITHDLTTAYQVADNIMVLYRGQVVEAGSVENVINNPAHPYTKLLTDCIPKPDPDQKWSKTSGDITIQSRIIKGCDCAFCNQSNDKESFREIYEFKKNQIVSCKLSKKMKLCADKDISKYFIKPKK
ncbi:MAG: ABC transporter ATP-binding protein [Candidatus Marinimicrobia bacterium]|nr:ABC transporter ATP-binding protein [Candidatus Neomarinimicrobiota bacterium]